MAVRIGEDERRQCDQIKNKKHQRKQPRSQDVLNPREYGEACEYEADSSRDRPELSSQRHPFGDVNGVLLNVKQMSQAEGD